jgi:hypothetical protein
MRDDFIVYKFIKFSKNNPVQQSQKKSAAFAADNFSVVKINVSRFSFQDLLNLPS